MFDVVVRCGLLLLVAVCCLLLFGVALVVAVVYVYVYVVAVAVIAVAVVVVAFGCLLVLLLLVLVLLLLLSSVVFPVILNIYFVLFFPFTTENEPRMSPGRHLLSPTKYPLSPGFPEKRFSRRRYF